MPRSQSVLVPRVGQFKDTYHRIKRDKRFRKVGPNTFEAMDDMLIQAV